MHTIECVNNIRELVWEVGRFGSPQRTIVIGIMNNLSILGDNTTMLCAYVMCLIQVLMLGLMFEFMVLFFMVRFRVSFIVRVINTCYVYVFYEKNHSFISFSLCD